MDKAYQKLVFTNNQSPAINDQNLNRISTAIDVIDDRVIELYDLVQQGGGGAGGSGNTSSGDISVTQTQYDFTITISDTSGSNVTATQTENDFTIIIGGSSTSGGNTGSGNIEINVDANGNATFIEV